MVAPSSHARPPFESYLDGLIHSWTKILATLGFTLIPLFFLLDVVTVPRELWVDFAVYRAVTTGFVLAQYAVLRLSRPTRNVYLHPYVFSAIVSAMIVAMTTRLGGFDSSYYAGLNLVIVAVNVLMPWRAVHTAANSALTIVMYLLANGLSDDRFLATNLINNLYFLGSMGVIAVAISYTKHALIAQEFRLRDDLKAARDALWGEMEMAKRIQMALVPSNRRLGKWDAAGLMQPAAEVGGDYYDFVQSSSGESWVAVGDVSGHGVDSGLVMMMTQTALLTAVNAAPGREPTDIFREVNRALRENISRLNAFRYVTLNVVRLDDEGFTFAGKHQDILVWRARTQAVEVVSNQGSWAGIIEDTFGANENTRVKVEPGDAVLFFTDGVTEAANAAGEMFGQERLVQAFAEVAEGPVHLAVSRIAEAVVAFRQRQDDDLTLVMLRR